ncbi:hypothetical protein SteCoe_35364 [Stentor coeruleus]|uniref:B box-type domain-containing protein n=1 Tax=Stentor coeruleus TaxID=5963 RepID=A0A1R2ASG0_9CILI|nr:hypothetical protein SteCoe_35364 [Stentor coeruleus]
MDRFSCKECGKPTKILCQCEKPGVWICSKDYPEHEQRPGSHAAFSQETKSYLISENLKKQFKCKLESIKQETLRHAQLLKSETEKIISTIKERSEMISKELESFISMCNSVINDVDEIESIPDKLFFTPFESYLVFSKYAEAIHNLYPPSFSIIKSIPKIFSYKSSTMFHTLYNYSEYACGFKSYNEMIVFPKKRKVHHPMIFSSARLLAVSDTQILITGGDIDGQVLDNVYILKLPEKYMKQIHPLKAGRKWHSMAWINKSPCVIGGSNGSNDLASVEMYFENDWVTVKDLNMPRSSLSSISYRNTVWVVGGISGNDIRSIEKYEDGIWNLLDIRFDHSVSSVALICLGDKLLIIGGTNKTNNQSLFLSFDTENEEILHSKTLEDEYYFPYNMCIVENSVIKVIDNMCFMKEFIIEDT